MDLKSFIDQGSTILVVDDVPSARKVVARLLNKIGFNHIVEAGSGDEALQLMKDNQVKLIISDWNMPAMDGLALLSQLRSNVGDVPFILITSSADRDEVIQAYKAGISDYIVKPFNGETLLKKVESVVSQLQESAK